MIIVAAVTATATGVLAVFAGIQICALAKQTKEANRTSRKFFLVVSRETASHVSFRAFAHSQCSY